MNVGVICKLNVFKKSVKCVETTMRCLFLGIKKASQVKPVLHYFEKNVVFVVNFSSCIDPS